MSKKSKWPSQPDLPAGMGLVTTKATPQLQALLETRSDSYVWVVLNGPTSSTSQPVMYIFKMGMQALAAVAVATGEDYINGVNTRALDTWLLCNRDGGVLCVLMRKEVQDPEGVRNYDKAAH